MRRGVSPAANVLFVLMTGSAALAQYDEKPNILFVFADDQCFQTVAAMGNPEIQTPNLDQLVESGTVFTLAYNMGSWSGAVCVASRTMLNTGRFIWRANAVYNLTGSNSWDWTC